jgi:copper-containing nitrite reductase
MRERPSFHRLDAPLNKAVCAETSIQVASRDVSAELLPVEIAKLTVFPFVPPPIERRHPVRLVVSLESSIETVQVSQTKKMDVWTFNKQSPGPFIRARQGDLLEVRHTNSDQDGLGHNIDFHAVTGPGGGAPALFGEQGETKVGYFRLLQPGLFVYHCAAGPVPVHIARGMHGMILVEPEEGLPPVDKEFAIMQSEIYADEADKKTYEFSYQKGLDEDPTHVVFNGRETSLIDAPLIAKTGDRVRLYVGNAGPNLVSSFHIIGSIMDRVYREGDLISPPARSIQTTLIPAGGVTVVELDCIVPGSYALVDHSIFRMEKGCAGFLKVLGEDRPDVFASEQLPAFCPGCKLH